MENFEGLLGHWLGKHADDADLPLEDLIGRPAGGTEIAALEQRLGLPLPPDYRALLEFSNGIAAFPNLTAGGPGLRGFLRANEVGWLHEEEPEIVTMYVELIGNVGLDEVLTKGPPAAAEPMDDTALDGDVDWDPTRLPFTLKIAEGSQGDPLLLLDPYAIGPNGEWEVWDLANANPGVLRYGTLENLLRRDLRWLC